jgi:Protein of unknown function (DUF3300)
VLYPDSLLAQVLMASTYPLEVVEVDRWINAHKDLKGDALAVELEKVTWDPSVKSLVNFPDVLTMMSEKLDWTSAHARDNAGQCRRFDHNMNPRTRPLSLESRRGRERLHRWMTLQRLSGRA